MLSLVACDQATIPDERGTPAAPTQHANEQAAESPYLYGIHDHDPNPQEFLDHIKTRGATGWVTATVAIGNNPNDAGGGDFSWLANQGHTVIVRLNNGYCGNGTIPVAEKYDDFARRAANYVAASRGANIWVIGNETNLAGEWPPANSHARYVSPQDYARLFRKVYDAIKAVRPGAKVVPQALAPFAGPYGTGSLCGYTHDANPLNWVQYLNQMLTAIRASGGIDGVALHINSRGYTHDAIHSTQRVNAAGQALYFSFYVYKDWVNLGIPPELYHLPIYATESNGIHYWSGGHPENPSSHYEPGWVQAVYAEINRYNQEAVATGKPIFRSINLYRWCAWCDGWNIDGSRYKGQILADLDQAVSAGYRWPTRPGTGKPDQPPGANVALRAVRWSASSSFSGAFGGDKAYDGVVSASSKWTSTGSTPESWLALDLGVPLDVTGFIVRHAGAAHEPTSFNTQAYRLESGTSLSGPWGTLASVNNAAQENSTTTILPSRVTARYVRLYITDAGIDDYARIAEFEVYGSAPAGDGNLITNGAFESGLAGWSPWIERGTLNPGVSNGQLDLHSSNHNGGVYQRFKTGGAGATVSVTGFWASDPTAASSQWAEVLVINGPRLPVNGADTRDGQGDVVLLYKNDTWATPVGWSGSMGETAPVANRGTFVAADSVATIVLKSGNVGGLTTGTRFDGILVRAISAPPQNRAPVAVVTADPLSGDAPVAVSFDGRGSSDPDGDPLTYAWDFGDGARGTGATGSHPYERAGSYRSTLTVADGRGGSDTASVTLTVRTPPPPPSAGNLIANGGFEGAVQGNGVGDSWIAFSSPGYGATYAVVTNQVHGGEHAQAVFAPQPSTADQYAGVYQRVAVEPGGRYTIRAWNRTSFPGQNPWDQIARLGIDLTGGTDFQAGSVEWREFDSAKDAWHRLEMAVTATGRSLTVFLQAWRKWASGGGSTAWFDAAEVVPADAPPPPGNGAPLAVAQANPTSGTAPLAVAFAGTGSSDPDGDPLTYAWDFGDGTRGSGATVSHTYQSAGTYVATLMVADGRGASDDVSVVITVGPRLPDYCPSALAFAAIRDQLNQGGQDLAFAKIGFHVGPGGNERGLGEWMRCLDAARVPFFLKSADAAGPILEGAQLKAASGVPHVLVYRKSGGAADVPRYDLAPQAAAVLHWQLHRDAFPPELLPYKHLIWLETINEVDKGRAEWLAEFASHTAQLAVAEGFNWAAFGWSSGEPEPEHWEGPKMRAFLELAGNNPDRVAVALHEYSFVQENLDRLYPYLVGRFQRLLEICDGHGIRRPTVLITEFGWSHNSIAHSVDQAMSVDIPWAAQLYARFPQVQGAAIWYLGPGYGGIANAAQQLIAPVTAYSLQHYFAIPR
ncbi:MAG: PKD domain-containing protein [Gemmatimonadales bacterium]